VVTFTSTASAAWQAWTITPATYYANTATTWGAWNSGTTVTASGLNPWQSWTSNTISVTSAANIAGTWNSWLVKGPVYAKPLALPVETDDERAARVQAAYERNQAWERERKIAAEQRRVAIGKADKLLESVLSHVQREQLRKDEAFLVRGQSGKVYRVRKGRGINVDEIALETGDVVRTLCAYPGINVPDGDTMAAQKLMLEADEADFLAIAIKHQARGPKVERAALDALLESLA
jgi:hypothetical protein